mmetsp:Transcript_48851/g.109862  ORF Transcript_48851/g.109862 Transcript_48851/m.109862 type:complete len:263 (-) Transcript_48851:7-795(-)
MNPVATGAHADGEVARLPSLRKRRGHSLQPPRRVRRERDGDLEGPGGVDAGGARRVLLHRPVAMAVPVRTATVAGPDAAAVVAHVQGRVPGVHVCLLKVDLRAADAADAVRVAVVVKAPRRVRVLPHGDQVQGSVAAASSPRHVRGVAERPSQERQGGVLLVVVGGVGAGIREVRPALHVRDHATPAQVGDLHRPGRFGWDVPLGVDERNRPVTRQVDGARAGGRANQEASRSGEKELHGAVGGHPPDAGTGRLARDGEGHL